MMMVSAYSMSAIDATAISMLIAPVVNKKPFVRPISKFFYKIAEKFNTSFAGSKIDCRVDESKH